MAISAFGRPGRWTGLPGQVGPCAIGDRLGEVAAGAEGEAEIILGLDRSSALKAERGGFERSLVQLPMAAQGGREVGVEQRGVGIESQGRAVLGDRFRQPSQTAQGIPEAVVGWVHSRDRSARPCGILPTIPLTLAACSARIFRDCCGQRRIRAGVPGLSRNSLAASSSFLAIFERTPSFMWAAKLRGRIATAAEPNRMASSGWV